MKRIVVAQRIAAGLFFLAAGPGQALACKAPNGTALLNQTDLQTALVGSSLVACFPASGPPWTNQETLTGSTISDYKNGPVAPGNNDPTSNVGTFAVSNDGTNGIISYTYTGATAAEFYVQLVSGTPGVAGATYTFYGPGANGNNGPCRMYSTPGSIVVKAAPHC